MLALEVQPRGSEPADALREKGVVPAVFYGLKEKATPIAINALKLEHLWKAQFPHTRLSWIGRIVGGRKTFFYEKGNLVNFPIKKLGFSHF